MTKFAVFDAEEVFANEEDEVLRKSCVCAYENSAQQKVKRKGLSALLGPLAFGES